jgi:hypothetical protein
MYGIDSGEDEEPDVTAEQVAAMLHAHLERNRIRREEYEKRSAARRWGRTSVTVEGGFRTVPKSMRYSSAIRAASVSNSRNRDSIACFARETIVVDLNNEARVEKLGSDGFYTQRPVDEECGFIRRVRSGLLLQWHWSLNGSPLRGPRRNRRPGIARKWMKPGCPCPRSRVDQTRQPDS